MSGAGGGRRGAGPRPAAAAAARLAAVTGLLLALLLPPAAATARGGDAEARVRATCGRGASAELRAKADDGAIEVRLRIDSRRAGERWRISLVHERRIAWRLTTRTRGGGSLRLRRVLPDLAGADELAARATGPRGLTCTATVRLGG